jgi:hypothetical protein
MSHTDLLTELNDLTRDLTKSDRTVMRQLYVWTGGFPTGGSSSPAPVRDPDEDPDDIAKLPPPDYNDRTGELGIGRDTFAGMDRDYQRAIKRAVEELRKADRIRMAATSRPAQVTTKIWCKSCERVEDYEHKATKTPARSEASSLCEWCAVYLREHGKWPVVSILEMHIRGLKISEQMIVRAERQARTSA